MESHSPGPKIGTDLVDRNVVFVLLPSVHLLDLAGPAQVFETAIRKLNLPYTLSFCSTAQEILSAQGLFLSHLEKLPPPSKNNLILIPGTSAPLKNTKPLLDDSTKEWLQENYRLGAHLASICSGVAALGEAGLLNGRRCTAHWADIADLQEVYPATKVQEGVLYINDGNITTSAGVASGIDMALGLIEKNWSPKASAEIARHLVIYLRRSGLQNQISIYLKYRTHLNPYVHRTQDWLAAHTSENPSLPMLAKISGTSSRSLTRLFKEATGITPHEYHRLLKIEFASHLVNESPLSLEQISARAGFGDPRHFRRVWTEHFGQPPSAQRSKSSLEKSASYATN